MRDETVRPLWSKFLSGEALSAGEERTLLEALQADDALRREYMAEADFDGLLRGVADLETDPEASLRAFREYLAAERDESHFIRKVQLKKKELADSTNVGRRTRRGTTRRAVQRRAADSAPYYWLAASVAAALLVALLFALPTSGPRGSASTRREQARASKPRESEPTPSTATQKPEPEGKPVENLRKPEEPTRPPSPPAPEPKKPKKETEAPKFESKAAPEERKEPEPTPPTPPQPPAKENPQETPKENRPSTTVAQVGTIETAEGEVFVVRPSGREAARAGQMLRAQEGIETGAAGRANVVYTDKTVVSLEPETSVSDLPPQGGKRLQVNRGRLTAEVAKQTKDKPMVFVTPHGTATVLGTTLRILIDPDPKKGTRLEVEEGKVELKNLAGRTVLVQSGYYAVAATGIDLVAKVLPTNEIFLPATQGKISGIEWRLVKDEKSLSGFALEASSPASAQLNKDQGQRAFQARRTLKSFVTFAFNAEANRDYHVWIRGMCTTAENKEPFAAEVNLEIVGEGKFVEPCPHFAPVGENAFNIENFVDEPSYSWRGSNHGFRGIDPSSPDKFAVIRFAKPGSQTLRLYVAAPLIRVDALWLSTTQMTRPDSGVLGPKTSGTK